MREILEQTKLDLKESRAEVEQLRNGLNNAIMEKQEIQDDMA